MTDLHIARQMWTRFEPIHAVTYFSPEARAAYERPDCAATGAGISPVGPRHSARWTRQW